MSRSAGLPCRMTAGALWSSRPRTTCSRARRRRRCRTSILRSGWTNSRGFPMSDLLWQKPGIAVDTQIQAFLAGDDVVLDREFFLHDIAASRAHAQGLQRIGMLSGDELSALERELDA